MLASKPESPGRATEGGLLARCLAGSVVGHLAVGVLLVLLVGIPERGSPERAVRVRLMAWEAEAPGPEAMPAEARRPSAARRPYRSRPREAGGGHRPGELTPAPTPEKGGAPEEGPSHREPEAKESPGPSAEALSSSRAGQGTPPAPLASQALEGFESSSGPGLGPGGGRGSDQFGDARPAGGGDYGRSPAEGSIPARKGDPVRGVSGLGGGGGPGGGTAGGIGAVGGAGSGGARAGTSPADLRKLILARIEGAKRYPLEARRRGIEGSAVIRFRIAPDGSVAAVEVVWPSGSPVLDEASRETILRASPFPVVDGWIQVQLSYGLTD